MTTVCTRVVVVFLLMVVREIVRLGKGFFWFPPLALLMLIAAIRVAQTFAGASGPRYD
jgi:hypothetical protein